MDAPEATIFTAVLITSIVLAVVLSYFIITIIRQHRRSRELYRSKILAEITTLEKERSRIAADLHDELAPLLLSVKYKINSFELELDEDEETLEDANKNIDHSIDRIREISNDLLPDVLLRKGLVAAIHQSINGLQKKTGCAIDFAAGDIPLLEKEKVINIYRVVQEVVHNTIKHARASELKINMNVYDGLMTIQANDNGIGFDHLTQIKEYSGLGLRNLSSRIEILGGNMYLDGGPGKGTQYIFEIPV